MAYITQGMSATNDIESLETNKALLSTQRKTCKVKIITIAAIILLMLSITAWVLFGITKKSLHERDEKIKMLLRENNKNELLMAKHMAEKNNNDLLMAKLKAENNNNDLSMAKRMAEFEMNAIRGRKNSKHEFELNPEFDLSSNVLKLSKDSFNWGKHRQFCRDEVEKKSHQSYQIVENKILTAKMIKSKEFQAYAKKYYDENTEDLIKLMPQRLYQLNTDSNTNMDDEKKNFMDNVCDNIIDTTQSEFILKAVHLAAGMGIVKMNKQKWDKEKYTCEKLWKSITAVLEEKVSADYSVAKNQETNEALNAGVVIEKRFPLFEGCEGGRPAETKIMTLWGRAVIAVEQCNHFKPVYRLKDGSFIINEGYNATEVDLKVQQSVDVKWTKLVKWSEIIANYVGADRLRVDWFHKYDDIQFNELGYPGAHHHHSWNKMLSDILYDGYKDNVYKKRESTKLLPEEDLM